MVDDVPYHSYAEHEPGPDLSPFVDCFWTRRLGADAGERRHVVVPDGSADILCELRAGGPRVVVVGAMTRPIRVESTGAVDLVAVRFRPGCAGMFLGPAVSEWNDQTIDLRDVWDDVAPLEDALAVAATTGGLIGALSSRLRDARRDPAESAMTRAAVAAIDRDPGITVNDLADRLGVTRQHLTRQFRAMAGLGPKQMQRVLRMRRAVDSLQLGGDPARVAIDCGYCDQSHLTNELKQLTGRTPRVGAVAT